MGISTPGGATTPKTPNDSKPKDGSLPTTPRDGGPEEQKLSSLLSQFAMGKTQRRAQPEDIPEGDPESQLPPSACP